MDRAGGSEVATEAVTELAALCVTWNSAHDVPAFLQSLEGGLVGLAWRLVVVDNGSTDGTAELISRLAPAAEVVQTGANLGYAAAVNSGMRATAGTGAVLVLNPDVRLDPGCGAALMRMLHKPGTGIAVPVQRDSRGNIHPTLRRAPTVLRALGEAVLGGLRAGRVPALGEMVTDSRAYAACTRADWATGSVMAISRECADTVGAWDERYFLYSEETDFALRAREQGFELVLAPQATCEHSGGQSHDDPGLWALLTINRLRLFSTRHGQLHALAFRAALLLGEALRACGGGVTHRRALLALVHGERSVARLTTELRARLPIAAA